MAPLRMRKRRRLATSREEIIAETIAGLRGTGWECSFRLLKDHSATAVPSGSRVAHTRGGLVICVSVGLVVLRGTLL